MGLNFDTLQSLRNLAAKLIPVPAILRASIATLKSIQSMNESLPGPRDERRVKETAQHLNGYLARLEEYIESTSVVQQRIENMTKFVSEN